MSKNQKPVVVEKTAPDAADKTPEQIAAEQAAAEQAERDRVAAEAAQQAELERHAAEQAAAEQAERERQAAEQAAAAEAIQRQQAEEKAAAEQAEQDRLAALDAERDLVDGEFFTTYGGPMVDPDSGVEYSGVAKPGPLTGWLKYQLENNTIRVKE